MSTAEPAPTPGDVLSIAVVGWQDEPAAAAWLGAARRRRIPGPEPGAVQVVAGGLAGTATWEIPTAVLARGGGALWEALRELHDAGHEVRVVLEPDAEAIPLWAIVEPPTELPGGLPTELAGSLAQQRTVCRRAFGAKGRAPVRSRAAAAGGPQPPMPAPPAGAAPHAAPPGVGTPVTLIVPCFREAANAAFLLRTLDEVAAALAPRWEIRPLLVDDGSDDGTALALGDAIAARPPHAVPVELVQHRQNRGVAAAIHTGLQHAGTDYCASMDADGSYDPLQLAELLPLLQQGADLVTGSPYHPRGTVRHVPGWRLLLSKTLSRMYRLTTRAPVHTFTSCFRAYRRTAVADLPLTDGRYLGIAELLLRVHQKGGTIREVPAILETRLYGVSKLRTLRVILGHLKLWARTSFRRLR